jgi:hypothetical protein
MFSTPHTAEETVFPGALSNGSMGPGVRRLQEWLGFGGCPTSIDGDFGGGTLRALNKFQKSRQLPVTAALDPQTWSQLVQPMTSLLAIRPAASSLPAAMLELAEAHLARRPIELGGDNRGPWVRMYMNGNEGREWRWCAGFVCFVMKQACSALRRDPPIRTTFSCDSLAAFARETRRLRRGEDIANGEVPWSEVGPLAIFLVRHSPGDWCHTGFAVRGEGGTFATIEGNTNDDGSSNGFEVCGRSRSVKEKDFILLS